jgi:glycerophosphoryl diester phosphodiesterase
LVIGTLPARRVVLTRFSPIAARLTSMRRRTMIGGVLAAGAGAAFVPDAAALAHRRPGRGPIVIGHRGASGYRPEHTLAAYRLAIALGADYIEPDLVSTKDGQLVARHENEISGTTNVAARPEFAARRTAKTIDGVTVTGWFTEDFTLAELKTLRAVERLPAVRPHNTLYDRLFEVPTLQEVIDLAKAESRRLGRTIGVYPETKHPSYFASIGMPLEGPLVRTLRRNGWAHRQAPVYLQSFETSNLRQLRDLVDVPLVQLLSDTGAPWDLAQAGDPRTYADLARPDGLRWIAGYANGIGANKNLIIARDSTAPTSVVTDAHAVRLAVHAWTFRNENAFLPADLRRGTDPNAWGEALREYARFYATGLDGLFADFPDTAVLARSLVAAT